MMKPLALLALPFALAACATMPGPRPTDVTRYHLGQPLPAGSVAIEPTASLESQNYGDAVAAELARFGFAPAAGTTSQYVAAVAFNRTGRGQVRTPPKFSIGLGGGSFGGGRGGGVGLGGGVSTGIGSKTLDVYGLELAVQIRRRSDNTTVWEGRAITEELRGRDLAAPGDTAQKLAHALFTGFPGESGITITVK